MGLLNAEDLGERDHLTREWRDHKLQELNFVGVVVRWTPIPGKPVYPKVHSFLHALFGSWKQEHYDVAMPHTRP